MTIKAIACGAALAALSLASPAAAQNTGGMGAEEMARFLVQARCVDAAGRTLPLSPIDAACTNRWGQTRGAAAGYRKHDWASTADRPAQPLGYQASDSVIAAPPSGPGDALVIAHTFDFGGGAGFGVFDRTSGDGGQALVVTGGSAAVFMTEDGGGGLQWFVGQGCQSGQRPRELAWLMFHDDVDGQWRDDIAQLSTTRSQLDCPAAFSQAYTRYVRARLSLPFQQSGQPAGSRVFDVVLSEHFDLPTVQQSTHLERFYLAKDLGMARWERWQARPSVQEGAQADYIATSGRCPALAMSVPPAPGWRMIDCRMWTNIVPATGGWTADRFGWPGLEARAQP